jgi:hypothetical protein
VSRFARSRPIVAVTLSVVAAAATAYAQPGAQLTPDQQRAFLLKAEIVSARPAGKGITGSLRLTLSDGRITHDAGFQTIDDRATLEDRRRMRKRAGELNFVDSFKYNIAAYEIARLLQLDDMMPVTVERRYQGKVGSLTWWVDDVLMDEEEREKSSQQPPVPLAFQRQRMKMFVFSELVGDVDRNKGNVLYTKDWRVVMIDFSRAFRLHADLRQPAGLTTIDRRLWEQLQKLTRDGIADVVGANLTLEETSAVARRQRALIAHYQQLIKTRGEHIVLY